MEQTVGELRAELRERGLSMCGRKAELVQRLLAARKRQGAAGPEEEQGLGRARARTRNAVKDEGPAHPLHLPVRVVPEAVAAPMLARTRSPLPPRHTPPFIVMNVLLFLIMTFMGCILLAVWRDCASCKERTLCEQRVANSQAPGIAQLFRLSPPKCLSDGSFSPTQCRSGSCWCVDARGEEASGTRSSSLPVQCGEPTLPLLPVAYSASLELTNPVVGSTLLASERHDHRQSNRTRQSVVLSQQASRTTLRLANANKTLSFNATTCRLVDASGWTDKLGSALEPPLLADAWQFALEHNATFEGDSSVRGIPAWQFRAASPPAVEVWLHFSVSWWEVGGRPSVGQSPLLAEVRVDRQSWSVHVFRFDTEAAHQALQVPDSCLGVLGVPG